MKHIDERDKHCSGVDEECCCGHDHEENSNIEHKDGCCCEGHEHSHSHEGDCCCKGHSHNHEDSCGCHSSEENESCENGNDFEDIQQKIYILENLGCANCAAKMEKKIKELPQVLDASITFSTKQLRIKAKNPDQIVESVSQICNSIEDGITVREKEIKSKKENKKGMDAKEIYERASLALGAVLFVAIVGIHLIYDVEYNSFMIAGLVIGYLVLGGGVIFAAVKNIFKGRVFDENFLMAIATIGAIAIGDYPEAVGVMLFFRVGELFEDIAVEKSRSQIMAAVDLRPEVVNIIDGECVEVIGAEEAKVGQIALVRPGDRIPLDGVVVKGESRVDTSAVTGESIPIKVTEGSNVISGTVNTSGVIQIEILKPLSESMVTRILNAVENAASSKPKIDNFITRFARVYTPIVVLLALFTAFGIPVITGDEFTPWIYTALTFLVMSCPCALVLSVPLAFFCGIGAGSKKGILFKGGIVMEALARIKTVVMDKTGTITEGNFALQSITSANGFDEETILKTAAACEMTSTHPIGISIVEAAEGMEFTIPDVLKEISGKGIEATLKGKKILCGNAKLLIDRGVDISEYEPTDAGTQVLLAIDGIYAGNLVIADTVKKESKGAIEKLNMMGITTAMMTGDSDAVAAAVSSETGILQTFSQLLPEEKFEQLKGIRDIYGSTMFVGDGINDAPVLAGADVGAAMGSGADAAIEAADLVFMNSNLDGVPTAINISKKTTSIAKQNVIGALAIKMIVMALGITGIYANMWLAVFADTGVAMICILNSIRVLLKKYE